MKYLQLTTAILLMGVLVAVAQVGPQHIPSGGSVYYANTPKPVQTNRFSLFGYISGFFRFRSTSYVTKPTPKNSTFNFGYQFLPKGSNTNNSKGFSYGDKSDGVMYPSRDAIPKPVHRGVAQILFKGEKHICNGVQLRPWLLLTAAKCVYGKDVKQLGARINIRGYGIPRTMMVEALDMTIHPKYNPKKLEYNFAMLIVDSKMEWKVDAFTPEDKKFTTDEILKKKFETKVDQMFDQEKPYNSFFLTEVDRKLTRDFEVCDEIGEAANWYCAEKGNGRAKYTLVDVGTPLYYYNDNHEKMLLGIYSGRRSNEESNGHVFESIYPVSDFIHRFYATREKPQF